MKLTKDDGLRTPLIGLAVVVGLICFFLVIIHLLRKDAPTPACDVLPEATHAYALGYTKGVKRGACYAQALNDGVTDDPYTYTCTVSVRKGDPLLTPTNVELERE